MATVWQCPECGVSNGGDQCICRRARPMTRKGFPQLFSGMVFHFNGIIPRTLKHPSLSIEWRMAEAHGAQCVAENLLDVVTHLIYRPGYERSEKVRAVVRANTESRASRPIICVPIKWMLDSMLHSRQLHESLYWLPDVPAEALPTSNSTVLQHHQHPYFMQHYEEFIPVGCGAAAAAQVGSAAAQLQAAMMSNGSLANRGDAPPQLDPIPALVSYAIAETWTTKPSAAAKALFRGLAFVFAGESLQAQAEESVKAHGGIVVAPDSRSFEAVTHTVFSSADKKSAVMITAVEENARRSDKGGQALIKLVSSNWLLDSIYLEMLMPATGPYVATAKLIQTLTKRAQKRGT